MKIYHVELGQVGYGASGGETSLFETVRFLQKEKINNVVITTSIGKKKFENLGLYSGDFLEFQEVFVSPTSSALFTFFSYIKRTIKAVRLVSRINPTKGDVLMCHSDFFPNSISFYFLAKKSKETKLFYWMHAIAPNIFRGYSGQFTGRFYLPSFSVIFYSLNQWLHRRIVFRRGVILGANPYHREILQKKYPHNKVYIFKHFGGGVLNPERFLVSPEKKKYDCIWMARFQGLKGILDVPGIIYECKKERPGISILVLGGGDNKLKDTFFKDVKERGLQASISYKGFITGEEKYGLISNAKIFLNTSYYESYGLTNLEAMSCGTPVVAYNLPVYGYLKKGAVFSQICDKRAMAKEVIKLLSSAKELDDLSAEAFDFAKEFSWEKMGQEIVSLIQENK